MKTPSIKWEDVTPKKAAAYLAKNVTNRSLREPTVAAYEADMRAGNWVPTHQGIAFNDREELIDGQHRLTAVVRSGVTVRMLVTRGLPSVTGDNHTMDAVDRGAGRSIADQLKLQHGFTNPNLGIAAIAVIANVTLRATIAKQTVAQVLNALEVYGRHIAEVGKIIDQPTHRHFRRSAFVAALAFARAVEPAGVDRFIKGILSGASLDADSPVLTLRNFMLSDAALDFSGSRGDRKRFAYVTLNSIRSFVEGEKAAKVQEDRAGFIFFAGRQKASIQKLSQVYLSEPASLDPDPPRSRKIVELPPVLPARKATAGVIKSAADINWKPNAAVNNMLRGQELSERAHRKAEAV
jgi:hypothetical protein